MALAAGGRRGYSDGGGQRKTIYMATCDDDHSIQKKEDNDEDGKEGKEGKEALLGTRGQLCSGFFHREETCCLVSEEGSVCLRAPNTVLVVRVRLVRDEGEERLGGREGGGGRGDGGGGGAVASESIFRYTSCWRGYSDSIHAEEFAMRDPRLVDAIERRSVHGGGGDGAGSVGAVGSVGSVRSVVVVDWFMSQQPCHFSSGRASNVKVTGKRSCTIKVLQWWRAMGGGDSSKSGDDGDGDGGGGGGRRLRRRRTLHIHLANIFRAFRPDVVAARLSSKEREIFLTRSASARDGLTMLMSEQNEQVSRREDENGSVHVKMINQEGWNFLFSLTTTTDKSSDDVREIEECVKERVKCSTEEDIFLQSLF